MLARLPSTVYNLKRKTFFNFQKKQTHFGCLSTVYRLHDYDLLKKNVPNFKEKTFPRLPSTRLQSEMKNFFNFQKKQILEGGASTVYATTTF